MGKYRIDKFISEPDEGVYNSMNKEVKISKGEQNEICVGNLEVIRDFLDVRDVIIAYHKILKTSKTREVYNVCSGNGAKLKEIIDLISNELNIEPKIIVDKAKIRPNEIMYVVGDNSKLKTELNWKPQYTLKNTIKDMIDYTLERNNG